MFDISITTDPETGKIVSGTFWMRKGDAIAGQKHVNGMLITHNAENRVICVQITEPVYSSSFTDAFAYRDERKWLRDVIPKGLLW